MKNRKEMRKAVEHAIDAFEMIAYHDGFESATCALDELSDQMHNAGDTTAAEILRWAAKELRGENIA